MRVDIWLQLYTLVVKGKKILIFLLAKYIINILGKVLYEKNNKVSWPQPTKYPQ